MTQQIVPIQVPLTNGVIRSFGHVKWNFAGLEMTGGVKSFKRSRTREREMVYSNSPDPVGKTLGENKYEASAVLYLDWFYQMQATLQNLGVGYGDQPFTIYVSYVGVNLVQYTDTILNCTFDKSSGDDQAGNNALTIEIDFHPTKILFNGIDDLADPLTASAP
jgi:hypothetical protein